MSRLQVITYLFSACYYEHHEDQREKLGEFVNVSSLRCPDVRHECRWEQIKLIGCVINILPPLRELDLGMVPSGIQDGQLRHLETLRLYVVEDWNWLLNAAAASLKCFHFVVGPSHSPLVDYAHLYPQNSLDHDQCLHIAKLTNLVSLFIDNIDMWSDAQTLSLLAVLSNLIHLETLHVYSISQLTCVYMVSPIFDPCAVPR